MADRAVKRLVLVGAGHTHMEVLRRGRELTGEGHTLTLVSPEPYHAYSGMGPGLLAGLYSLHQILLPAAALCRKAGAHYIRDRVVACDPDRRVVSLGSGTELGYDILSLNMGSEAIGAASGAAVYTAKPVAGLDTLRAEIERRCREQDGCEVSVIGAGPAGLELAANAQALLARFAPGRAAVQLFGSGDTPAGLGGSCGEYVLRHLARVGVSYHASTRPAQNEVPGDIVILATGLRPPAVLRHFGLPLAEDGSVCVDATLRSVSGELVFAVGDCARFSPKPLDRVGVYAVRMQSVLMANLKAAAAGKMPAALQRFSATGPYLAGFNLGFGTGLLYKGSWSIRGQAAFLMKDFIDRRFVRSYWPAGRRLR